MIGPVCHFYVESICQVVAEKQLVRHLQKEVARLNAELQSPEPTSSSHIRSLLMEKDRKIHQVLMLYIGVKVWIVQTHCSMYVSVMEAWTLSPSDKPPLS